MFIWEKWPGFQQRLGKWQKSYFWHQSSRGSRNYLLHGRLFRIKMALECARDWLHLIFIKRKRSKGGQYWRWSVWHEERTRSQKWRLAREKHRDFPGCTVCPEWRIYERVRECLNHAASWIALFEEISTFVKENGIWMFDYRQFEFPRKWLLWKFWQKKKKKKSKSVMLCEYWCAQEAVLMNCALTRIQG